MTTDYKTLKKELTKAIKGAGYNTKQIKLLKGSGVGSYYSETSFSLCSYGEDVEIEINEKGITVDKVNEITRETLQTYKAHAAIKASDALKAQFEDLAEEVSKKIEGVEVVGVIYKDNEKNVELYAHKYESKLWYTTKAANLKSDWVKNFTEKRINKDLISILVGIEIGDPEICDFSEAYIYDGNSKEEVDLNVKIYRTKQYIEEAEDKIAEEKELRNEIEIGLKEAKAAEVAIINTVATYETNWGTLLKTQRTEFSKAKFFELSWENVSATGHTEEDIKEAGYTENTAATTGAKIDEALNIIREKLVNKEEELQDQIDTVNELQSDLTNLNTQLSKLEADLQELLNK